MKDSILKGTGNSRYLKTSLAANTTWEQALAMLRNGTFPVDFNGINQDGFTQVGTALNRDNLLSTALASVFSLGSDATPNQFLAYLVSDVMLGRWDSHESTFDNITTPGVHWIRSDVTTANWPVDLAGAFTIAICVVFRSSPDANYYWQFCYFGDNHYAREHTSTGWRAWRKMTLDLDVATVSADGLMSAEDKVVLNAVKPLVQGGGTYTGGLNDLKTPGNYWVSTNNTNAGWPDSITAAGNFAFIEVLQAYNNLLVQRLTRFSGNTTANQLWIRSYVNATWQPWVQV